MNLPEDERLQAPEAHKKFKGDRENLDFYCGFPRPQCDSTIQVDQILDILDRFTFDYSDESSTDVLGDCLSESRTTRVSINVRSPGKRSKDLISKLEKNIRPFLQPSGSGVVSVRYSYEYLDPRDNPSADIQVRLESGPDGIDCINLHWDDEDTHFNSCEPEALLALKSRMLDGAPKTPKGASMTDDQLMTLLLLLLQADSIDSTCPALHRNLAGFFANDNSDDVHYPR